MSGQKNSVKLAFDQLVQPHVCVGVQVSTVSSNKIFPVTQKSTLEQNLKCFLCDVGCQKKVLTNTDLIIVSFCTTNKTHT